MVREEGNDQMIRGEVRAYMVFVYLYGDTREMYGREMYGREVLVAF